MGFLLAPLSCSRHENRGVERLVILPFENLTGDPALDWTGNAIAAMIANQTGVSTRYLAVLAAGSREAALERADRLVQGYFEKRAGGLRFSAVIRDAAHNRTVERVEAAAQPSTLVNTADVLSSRITERHAPFSSQNATAIQFWGLSLGMSNVPERIQSLRRAVEADPNFGQAYVELVQLLAATGQEAAAKEVIAQALDRRSNFNDFDRARIELFSAESRNDADGRRKALIAISRLHSADPEPVIQLSRMETAARRFDTGADYMKSAAALRPGDALILNELAYLEAYRGKTDEAREALERARAIQPDQPNFIDSLGEVHFINGRFEDAEKYFNEAYSRFPDFLGGIDLAKAAQCRLMRGDLAGADQLMTRYVDQQGSGNPRGALLQSVWLYITGRHEEARSSMAKLASNPQLAAYGAAQSFVWSMKEGDAEASKRALAQCTAAGQNPIALLCATLANPASAAPAPVQALAGVYGPVLRRDFAGAVGRLKAAYESTPPATDSAIRTMYAWALVETGHTADAAPLVERFVLPLRNDDPLFAALEFPKFLELRAAVRDSQGKREEGAQLRALVQKYSGRK